MSATRPASPFRAHEGGILRAPNLRTLPATLVLYRTHARLGFSGRRVWAAELAALAEFDLNFLAVATIRCHRQMIGAMHRPCLRVLLMHRAGPIAITRAPSVES
jgi:hypothetical protein